MIMPTAPRRLSEITVKKDIVKMQTTRQKLEMEPKPDLIKTELLQVGDILLTRSEGLLGATIRTGGFISTGTQGSFTHAMLCCDPFIFIEAMAEGTRKVDLRNCYVADRRRTQFLRISDKLLLPDSVDRIRVIANNMYSAGYSQVGAVGSVISILRSEKRLSVFCSQLVARCLDGAGVKLFGDLPPERITPTHIERCLELKDITSQILESAEDSQIEGLEYVDGGLGSNAQHTYQIKLREVYTPLVAQVSHILLAGANLGVSVRPESLQSMVDALAKTKQVSLQAGNKAVVDNIAKADQNITAAMRLANLEKLVNELVEAEVASLTRTLSSLSEASLSESDKSLWLKKTRSLMQSTQHAIQNRTTAVDSWRLLSDLVDMSCVALLGELEYKLLCGVQTRFRLVEEVERILT